MELGILYFGVLLLHTVYGQLQPQQQGFPTQNGFNNQPQDPRFQQPGNQAFPQPNQPTNAGFKPPNQPPNSGFQPPNQPPNTRFQQPGQPIPTGSQLPTGNQQLQPGAQQPNQQSTMTGAGPSPTQMVGQMTEDERSQINCAQAGRMAVSQCFQSNGGFDMMTVIALLSNGTQGQLPANSDQIKQRLCGSQRQIVACIFDSIRKFNGSEQCNSLSAFIRLEQETVGLMNSVQQMCGTGLLPRVTPCMRRINYDMLECYSKVGLNPELYTPQGSRMEGAIIGDNREVARMFCNKRQELFACQNSVLDACPRAKKLQALSGHDQVSMQNGMEVLCKDVDIYVKGLVCFQTPTPEVQTCARRLITEMTQVTMKQIRDNLSSEEFFREYCRARIANLKCDSSAWGNTCEAVAVGLKNEFQCNLLPTFCKNDTAVMDAYKDACAEDTFERALRNTDKENGASGIMMSFMTSLLTSAVPIVMCVL